MAAPAKRPARKDHRDRAGNLNVKVSGRMAALLAGELSVEDLDDEELARGRCRDKNGGFAGRPPAVVPRELHDRMTSELLKRGATLFKADFTTAISALAAIAGDPEAEDKDRIAAAKYIIERVAGKVPDQVHIAAADPWQTIIDEILITSEEPSKKPTRK